MRVDPGPLTAGALVQTWQLDLSSALVIVLVAGAYAWCYRRGRDSDRRGGSNERRRVEFPGSELEAAKAGCRSR